LCTATPARGQPGTRELYEQGRAAVLHKDWKRARELLARVWAKRESYDTAALLGQCELKLGDWRDAAEHLDYALRNFPNADPAADARARIKQGLASARSKVATVTVQTDPAGAEVLVDGVGLGRSPLDAPVYLKPGKHVIEAKLAGHASAQQAVAASEGQRVPLSLSLAAARRRAPSPASPPASTSGDSAVPPPADGVPLDTTTRPVWPAWAGAGVAVVGLATGIGFTVSAGSKQSDADALAASLSKDGPGACASGSPHASQCTAYQGDRNSVRTERNVALAGFIAGGVGAAFSVGYLIWRGNAKSSAARQGLSVRPELSVARSGTWFAVQGRF